jgi:hypothetical protein
MIKPRSGCCGEKVKLSCRKRDVQISAVRGCESQKSFVAWSRATGRMHVIHTDCTQVPLTPMRRGCGDAGHSQERTDLLPCEVLICKIRVRTAAGFVDEL